jgi:hypothetical protein
LANYVFAHEEDEQSLIVFGIGMLVNHREPATMSHYWSEDEPVHSSESYWTPSTMSSSIVYETTEAVERGEELFISYGGDDWFEDRDIPIVKDKEEEKEEKEEEGHGEKVSSSSSSKPKKVVLVDDEYLHEHAHCLTDVFVAESRKSMCFYGLFARRKFSKGEIVTISPLLPLPAEEVEQHVWDKSVLMNYCISSPGSKVAMLPIGYAAMINHDAHPNVQMEWYTWPHTNTTTTTSSSNDNDVGAQKHVGAGGLGDSGLGEDTLLKCLQADPAELVYESNFSSMDLKFVATRDIFPEEEITLDYGVAWINKWAEYMSSSLSYHAKRGMAEKRRKEEGGEEGEEGGGEGDNDADDESDEEKTIFRAFIEAPPGLFPERWTYFDYPEDSLEEYSTASDLLDAHASQEGLNSFYSGGAGGEEL